MPTARSWLGGIVAGIAAWSFAGVDVFAHRGIVDPLDAVLVAVGGIFIAVPRINSLRARIPLLGSHGVEVSINALQQAVDAASAASTLAVRAGDTAEEASKLFESWLRELDALLAGFAAVRTDRATYASAVFRFINTRLEDISLWVGGENEEVRAALWWWSQADGGACIVAAPRISDRETLEHVFAPGRGILGRVLLDGELQNVADAPVEADWQRIATTAPRYRGLLCLPIVVRGRVAGVLTVDRVRAEPFGDDSVRFARQVVALIKLAALHPAVPSDVFSLPLPQESAPGERRAPDFR